MNRTQLIEAISASRYRLMQAVEQFSDSACLLPDLPDGWSVKDVLAHIGWWEQRAARIYQACIDTSPSLELVPAEQVDTVNAKTRVEYQAVDLPAVRAFEQAAYQDLLTIVETIPENDLFAPGRFAWLRGNTYFNVVAVNTYDHYDEHAAVLETFLAGKKSA